MAQPKTAQIDTKEDRHLFWRYCIGAASGSAARARLKGFPHSISAYDIDELLVDQKWRCAITRVPLSPSKGENQGDPFAASLDRIVPELGYVKGNIRVVCALVNMAMGNWGLEKLLELLDASFEAKRSAEGRRR